MGILPSHLDPKRFRPIAPYSPHAAGVCGSSWADLYSGQPIAVTTRHVEAGGLVRLKTMGEVIRDYRAHPEAKCLGPDGQVCTGTTRGLLQPRPVVARSIHALGKESHKLESVEEGMEAAWNRVQQVYEPDIGWRAVAAPVLDRLTTEAEVETFAARAGLSVRTIWRLKRGEQPSPETARRVRDLVEALLDAEASTEPTPQLALRRRRAALP